jgi:CubicO group peptidase (beta-lactamase class C family)
MRVGLVTFVLVLWGSGNPAAAQTARAIAKLDRPPVIDGTLSDPAWQRATEITGFRMLHPDAGRQPTVRTEVRLAYDRSNIYIGIRALDQDSAQLRADATDTSGIANDDRVAFCLDSRADGIGAFYFVVTPRGVRGAGVLNFGGDPTATRIMRWTSAATIAAHGYTVAMAIPIAQLPFEVSGDSVVMAFKVARLLGHGGEEDDLPEIKTDRPHLAQLERIVLSGVVRSRTRGDGFVADLRDTYRAKVANGARFDYGTLEGRVHGWQGASIMDYLVFPSRPLRASREPFRFPRRPGADSVVARLQRLEYLPGHPIRNLDRFFTRTQTEAFIVIRNDTLLYEQYFNGYGRDSMMTSFSVAKSVASTLVGIAIDKGQILGVADPITNYLPELARRDTLFRLITIGDLLHMASGLRYVEGSPPYDNDITYLDPDLRRAALEKTGIVERPGVRWLYNNYNPLLIGMILERVSGRSITDLLQTELWEPLGMEFGGSWSIDSREHGFEKMESGINARAIDLAKLGALILHHGRWRGAQLVSAAWVRQATQPQPEPPGFYTDEDYFDRGGHYYGYFWWGSRRAAGESDFFGVGNKGEYIYCSPQKHLVIVRTGMQFGVPTEAWVRMFRQFADEF